MAIQGGSRTNLAHITKCQNDNIVCRIEFLDLSQNQISDFAGEKLALVLKKNNILKHLNLCDNRLKDEAG